MRAFSLDALQDEREEEVVDHEVRLAKEPSGGRTRKTPSLRLLRACTREACAELSMTRRIRSSESRFPTSEARFAIRDSRFMIHDSKHARGRKDARAPEGSVIHCDGQRTQS